MFITTLATYCVAVYRTGSDRLGKFNFKATKLKELVMAVYTRFSFQLGLCFFERLFSNKHSNNALWVYCWLILKYHLRKNSY